MSHLYVDIHVLQTVPPSNLNRDDAGAPKQALFGGTRRARVSSQAWKRATRKYFAEHTPGEQEATRTLRIASLVRDGLVDRLGLEAETAEQITGVALKPLGISPGRREASSAYLLFFGREQINRIVDEIAKRLDGAADLSEGAVSAALADLAVAEHLMTGHPLDVALFGRMVADLPAINVDAAVQVAHAVSTHTVETEYDYFTAVDDEKDRAAGDDAGAGMIGTVEFNSATLYRYATVGVHQLLENLDGSIEDTASGVQRFLEGFVRSMPTGHQTTFAHRTLPDAVVVATRDDQPVNLVSAFERPVSARDGGYVQASLRSLAEQFRGVTERWGGSPDLVASTYLDSGDEAVAAAFGPSLPFQELLDMVGDTVSEHLGRSAS